MPYLTIGLPSARGHARLVRIIKLTSEQDFKPFVQDASALLTQRKGVLNEKVFFASPHMACTL